jgi:hypothetical protein
MTYQDTLDMQGYLTIQVFDRTGQLIHTSQRQNSIVYSGRDLVAKLFAQQTIDPIRYIAVGTGNRAVDPSTDQALENEVFRKPLKLFNASEDLTDVGPGPKSDEPKRRCLILKADLDSNEPPSGPHVLQEAGLFNSDQPGKGVMYNRVVFSSGILKTTDFKLTLRWEIVF